MRNSSCHSPTAVQFAIVLMRKRHDLSTPSLTALLPVGYSWARHQIASFFSPGILYKSTLIGEIFLVSGGISLNPVPISLCMFGSLTASKGCSKVDNAEPRPKKKESRLQEPLQRAELLWDQCDKISHSFNKGALLTTSAQNLLLLWKIEATTCGKSEDSSILIQGAGFILAGGCDGMLSTSAVLQCLLRMCGQQVSARDIQTRKEVWVCMGLPLSDWSEAHSNTGVC